MKYVSLKKESETLSNQSLNDSDSVLVFAATGESKWISLTQLAAYFNSRISSENLSSGIWDFSNIWSFEKVWQ